MLEYAKWDAQDFWLIGRAVRSSVNSLFLKCLCVVSTRPLILSLYFSDEAVQRSSPRRPSHADHVGHLRGQPRHLAEAEGFSDHSEKQQLRRTEKVSWTRFLK